MCKIKIQLIIINTRDTFFLIGPENVIWKINRTKKIIF